MGLLLPDPSSHQGAWTKHTKWLAAAGFVVLLTLCMLYGAYVERRREREPPEIPRPQWVLAGTNAMTDQDLRALHAKWKSSGAPADGAAYLRALVRSGSMTEAQLRVAALCGHAGARYAVDDPGDQPSNPVEFVLALKDYGPEVYVRAAVAALEYARDVAGEHDRDRLKVVPLLNR